MVGTRRPRSNDEKEVKGGRAFQQEDRLSSKSNAAGKQREARSGSRRPEHAGWYKKDPIEGLIERSWLLCGARMRGRDYSWGDVGASVI